MRKELSRQGSAATILETYAYAVFNAAAAHIDVTGSFFNLCLRILVTLVMRRMCKMKLISGM